jgi:general secretion pathway protein F
MPIFKYRGYDTTGAETRGTVEADGEKDAVLRIKNQGIFPKKITEEGALRKSIISRKPSPMILADVTRRLSTLIAAGVPLIEAVNALSAEQLGEWKSILIDLKESIAGGSPLARAMQAHPDVFPGFYTGMIAAGESSGKLTDVLLKLADYLEKELTIRNKVKTALIYPLFMACVSIAIVLFLFTFVIPKITKIFEETSASLPFITVILMWISSGFKKFWWLLLGLAGSALYAFRKVQEKRKDIIDALLLKDPTGLLMSLYMLRFTMTMGFLLSGGLPILQAMQLTSRATGNSVLEQTIVSAENRVSQGARLSASLEGFPPSLLQIISTGEQTGQLPQVLIKTSESYESEFDRKLQRTISLLEPSLILIMGLIVGFIVISVLLPIFELNQLMQ